METAIRLDQAALASFELAVVKLDAHGVCTFANRAASQLLGDGPATGWSLADVFPDTGQAEQVQEELQKRLQGEASNYQTEFRRRDGELVPVSIFAFPVLDGGDQVSGSIAIVTDLRIPQARKRMHEAIESCRDGARLLASVADALRPLLPFEEFRVTALGRARQHLRTLFSTHPDAREKYPFKWWPMPPFVAKLADEEVGRVYDIPALYREPEFAAMAAADPLAAAFRDSGVTSTLSVPVVSGDRTIAFVSLDTHGAQYDDADLAVCDRLPFAEAVKMALHLEEQKALGACLALIREMGAAHGGVQPVAQVLVDALARSFGWDHIAVFQRDEERKAFLVLAQASGSGRSLDKDFTTGETGIVAMAFREQRIVNVPDVEAALAEGVSFVAGVPGIRSELALPICGERTQWVLNVESSLREAFADEEIDLLQPLLIDAGHILEQIQLAEIQSTILDGITDAVIETNQRGIIRSVNPAGVALLGAGSLQELEDLPLTDFLPEGDPVRELVTSGQRFSRREMRLLRRDGRPVPVLLSGSDLREGSTRRVFFASDLSYQEEVERTGLLKDVFRHASLECRVPLALATGWLDRLAEKKQDIEGDITRVLEQIRKADMPLERLLRAADATPGEPDPAGGTDLAALLDEVLKQFPSSERDKVDKKLPKGEVRVRGGSDDLRFCVETALSFAFRSKPQNSRVQVEMKVDDAAATFLVGGDWEPSLGTEAVQPIRRRWRRTAAADLALAEDVIEDIASRAHGSFHADMDRGLRLSLELPLLKEV